MPFENVQDDDIVISGIGCSLPEVSNLIDLNKILFEGVNPIKHDDTFVPPGYYGNYPEYQGHIRDPWAFDCTFFGVSKVVARSMDPMVRKILERTFEAILDAGLNPSDLKGSNSAFFSGTTFSDYDMEWDTHFRGGYGIMGRNRCMNANRISYWLDTSGTSVATDCNWADGIVNLELAYNAVKNGQCDTAVVNGASITIHTELMLQIRDMGVLCYDGKTKSFDDSADGYVRSDGVVVLVLQRASVAKRSYGAIKHVFSQTCGSPNSIYSMSSEYQWEDFLRRFYENSKINPHDVAYYEANGTGIREEDAKELNAATTIFCKDRETPLYIGSVKSNIGHTEAASALTSVVKACLCLENQQAPQNLHFSKPNNLVPGLLSGKLQVVKENTPLPENGLVAISAYGYGGVYAHMVLQPNLVKRVRASDSLPRLVFMADRMADTIEALLDKVEAMPYNEEYYGLLHNIHSKRVGKYLGRGYTILPKKEDAVLRETAAYNEEKRPVWFIFSGMGSQWNGMGKSLMALPLFRESIERSAAVLAKKNVDLLHIITTDDPSVFDNILHAFVGIAAIQVALVDILKTLEIVPDGIIGHSVGELGCSYADGGLTAEQMVLCAYYRGLASIESTLIRGFMAAIGKGYNDVKDEIPPEIDVACHNSADSCTLSGPAEIVNEYVDKLKADKVFAKTVNVANIAYHSRYIEPVAPRLLKYLQEVITDPKPRSSKWISTSNLEEEWETELAKSCSAEYHTKNLTNSVLFEEGSRHIPANAICIEIAPHGLLQAILKRSLDANTIHIPLTRRAAEDPLLFLFQAIGKMYLAGMHPQISKLYPVVEYPVSRGTPTITHLVNWNFEHEFNPNFRINKKVVHSIREKLIKTDQDCIGCVIDGKSLYPASVYLRLVWDISAMYVRKTTNEFSAIIRNFRLDKPFYFVPSDKSEVTIMINSGTRYMEMSSKENDIIGHGYVYPEEESAAVAEQEVEPADNAEPLLHSLTREDIYAEFQYRGYEFSSSFQPLERIAIKENSWTAYIKSSLDWTQKIEALIQVVILQKGERDHSLLYPISIGRVFFAPEVHIKSIESSDLVEIVYSLPNDTVKCPGIELSGIRMKRMEKPKSTLSFEVNHVVPYDVSPNITAQQFVEESIRIVNSNITAKRREENGGVNILRIVGLESSQLGIDLSGRIFNANVNVKTEKVNKNGAVFVDDSVDLVIGDFASLKHSAMITGKHSMVLVRGIRDTTLPAGFQVVSSLRLHDGEQLFLLNKAVDVDENVEFMTISDDELVLINMLNNRASSEKLFFLVGYEEPAGGADGYIRNVEEAVSIPLRWLFLLDKAVSPFNIENEIIRKQMRKGLTNNVYENGVWGYFERKVFLEQSHENELEAYENPLNRTGEASTDYIGINLDATKTVSEIVTDFSGRLRTGTAVMGVLTLNNRSMEHDPNLVWQVPKTWSQEEAATVVMPYLLAYYTIDFLGKIYPYENVLVTDALLPNSQAAIKVASKFAKNIYVTVANEDEKVKISRLFPKINENHIFLHDRKDFNIMIGLEVGTKEMPQVVYNSLEGEKFVAALRCLSSFGRFFNFGREDIETNRQIGSSVFLKYNTLYQVTPKKIMKLSVADKEDIHGRFAKGLKDGTIQPFPHLSFTHETMAQFKSSEFLNQKNQRVLFDSKVIKKEGTTLAIDESHSYIIIGDSSVVWLDLAESLLQRGASKLMIVRSDEHTSERTRRRIEFLTSQPHNHIVIVEGKSVDPKAALTNVQRLGPLAAVFLIALEHQENNYYSHAVEIDKLWRDKNGHFVIISGGQTELAKICDTRLSNGLPTTYLLWNADDKLIGTHLETITHLSGKEAVISVTNSIRNQHLGRNAGRVFLDNLPHTLEDFSNLGSSLGNEAELIELPTLGPSVLEAKNLSPLLIFPGLHSDPVRLVTPLAKRLRYPVLCAKLPRINKKCMQAIATAVVQKIKSLARKNRTFNVVGISSGCPVALEVTRQLEQLGTSVSIILIDNPIFPIQQGQLSSKTVQSVLLSHLASNSTQVKELPTSNWDEGLTITLNLLGLEKEQENAVREGATFVLEQLTALINYDVSELRLKGPMAVLRSDQLKEDFCYTKMCHNVVVRDYPENLQDLLESDTIPLLLHQAAICDDMSSFSVHEPSWTQLEDFLIHDRIASQYVIPAQSLAYMRTVKITEEEANMITL